MNVLDSGGFAFKSDCCSSTSDLRRPSSYHAFVSLPAPGVEDTALAIAIAADVEPPPPPGAAGVAFPIFADSMALLRASLIASASPRAFNGEVKEKTWVSDAVAPGGCANIFSITFALLAGVCWRSNR